MLRKTMLLGALLVATLAAALPGRSAATTCTDNCWSRRVACINYCGGNVGCKENCLDAYTWCLCSCNPAYCE